MPYRFVGLTAAPFQLLFDQADAALAAQGIRRYRVDEKPGFPCRISLTDAEIGEEVLLLSYSHQPHASPYQASGPIFVRRAATEAALHHEVPEVLRIRLLSVRAYDASHLMVEADVCEGEALMPLLDRLFALPGVDYLHIHFARRGCYACRVERA